MLYHSTVSVNEFCGDVYVTCNDHCDETDDDACVEATRKGRVVVDNDYANGDDDHFANIDATIERLPPLHYSGVAAAAPIRSQN